MARLGLGIGAAWTIASPRGRRGAASRDEVSVVSERGLLRELFPVSLLGRVRAIDAEVCPTRRRQARLGEDLKIDLRCAPVERLGFGGRGRKRALLRVGLHVRRGDALHKHQYYPYCVPDPLRVARFVTEATAHMDPRTVREMETVFVFTDETSPRCERACTILWPMERSGP